MHPDAPGPLVAVILAGGRARRLGGIAKTRVPLAGPSALDRVLAACEGAVRIVVGPDDDVQTDSRTLVVREDPPFGGPVAALARAVQEIDTQRLLPADGGEVAVLGGDMPHLRPRTLAALRAGDPTRVRTTVDATGHLQFLCAVWPYPRLVSGLNVATVDGADAVSMRVLYTTLGPDEIESLDLDPGDVEDIDTPEDLARARSRLAPPDAPPPVPARRTR